MVLWNEAVSNTAIVACGWTGLLSNPNLVPSAGSVPNWDLTVTSEATTSFPANDHGVYMTASSGYPSIHNGAMMTQGYAPLQVPEPPSLNIRVGDYSHYQFLVDAWMAESSLGLINAGTVLLARAYMYSSAGVEWHVLAHPAERGCVHRIEMEWLIGGQYVALTTPPSCAVLPGYDTLLVTNVLDPIPIGVGEQKTLTVSIDETLEKLRSEWHCYAPFIGNWIIEGMNVDDCVWTGVAGWLEAWNATGEGAFYHLDLLAT